MKKKLLTVAGVGILITLILFGLQVIQDAKTSQGFDMHRWGNGGKRERGRMVNDLLARNLLMGKGSNAIVELLGRPESRSDAIWGYELDMGVTFGGTPWPYYLVIKFDTNSYSVTNVCVND